MRLISLIFGLLLLSYASIALWLIPANALPESPWCRNWFCLTDVETQHEYQEYLQATVQQAPLTVAGFAEILRRDPAAAYRWCDLAEAMVESGQVEKGRYAIGRALERGPDSAPILLRAANLFFRINDFPKALEFSRTILGQIPDYDAIIFSNYDRFELPVEDILARGLPVNRRAAQSYLAHLLGTKRVADARQVWSWIRTHGFVDDRLAGAYVAFLLREKVFAEAEKSWADYKGRRGGYPATNRIFNGDFEMAPTGAPLDWQIGSTDGVTVARDGSSAHSGQYSLHLAFAGTTNVAFNQVSETAVIAPGAHQLTYFIKTSSITTNEGVRMRVFDPENPAMLDVLTEPSVGTNDWRLKELSFVVRPATHIVQVQVVRTPSQKFDNKIAGEAWIDDVKLSP